MKSDLARSKILLPDEVLFKFSLEGRNVLGILTPDETMDGEETETGALEVKGWYEAGMTLVGSRGKSDRLFCLGMGGGGRLKLWEVLRGLCCW